MTGVGKSRRVVAYSGRPTKGRPKLWAFGYPELSRLLGVSEAVLRQRVSRGPFFESRKPRAVELNKETACEKQ